MKNLSVFNQTLGILDNQDVDINQLILVAHRIGIHVNVYTDHAANAFQYADNVTEGPLTDHSRLKQFARQCKWVIYVNGSGIDSTLINYLSQFTDLPQGSDELDLINDQSILHVFLDSLNVPSLPYSTVFSLSDVKQALATMSFPVVLRPVQTSAYSNQSLLINGSEDLERIQSIFTGEAYLLESLPKEARYFNLTLFKGAANQPDLILPPVEIHYQGSKFNFAELKPKLSLGIIDQLKMLAQKVIDSLNYVGGLTFSFIVTDNHQIYVNGISLPFNLVNNVFNKTSDNVGQLLIRTLCGVKVKQLSALKKAWLIKPVNRSNVKQVQQLWNQNQLQALNLDSLIYMDNQSGYVLMAADSVEDVEKKLRNSQL